MRPEECCAGGVVMSSQDLFERIVASMQDAMLEDSKWAIASGLIDEACGTKGNQLITGDGRSAEDVQIFFARFCYRGQRDREFERLYFEVYHSTDERAPQLRRLADSKVVHISSLFTANEKKTSAVYNELLPQSGNSDSLNVRLDGPHGSRIAWGIADPEKGNGWSSAQIDKIERLLPHLRQFVRVRQALSDARALGSSVGQLLENTRCGVIQLDLRGRIVAANDLARVFLRRRDGIADEDGFLRAWEPAADDRLQELLGRALPPFDAQGESGSMTVTRWGIAARLALHVTPVNDGPTEMRPSRVSAIVLVVDPLSRALGIDAGLVAGLLGLTPAESRVAVALAQGQTIGEIARETGRKESTIRWHAKQIFAKHGISRQADLVKMVLALANLP